MEQLAIISHNFFRANGFHKSRSPSSPYGPAPQGSQLITMTQSTSHRFSRCQVVLTKILFQVLSEIELSGFEFGVLSQFDF